MTARALATVVDEICALSGVEGADVSKLAGLVRGYALDGGESARAALQPLLLAHGVDAIEADGQLRFVNRDGRTTGVLEQAGLARGEGGEIVTISRLPEAEVSGRVRLSFVEADGDYEIRAVESIFPDEATTSVARSELPLALTAAESQGVVERWLAEARVARDSAGFALPPSASLGVGDVVEVDADDLSGRFRIDRIQDAGLKLVEAVRVEQNVYRPPVMRQEIGSLPSLQTSLPVWAAVMDLPLLLGDDQIAAPWVAATSSPWPGSAAVYSSIDGNDWRFEAELERAATVGQTLSDLPWATAGLWDRGVPLQGKLASGGLASIDDLALFAGGNAALIGDGQSDWEVFQFRDAALVSPDIWELSHRLRGHRGTDGIMPGVWPAGSVVVVLDRALQQIFQASERRGVPVEYRVGPASKAVDHWSYVQLSHTMVGNALRPYGPVHLRAVRAADGAQDFSWVRRTRVEGDSWQLTDVPLGEASEAYMVRVRVGSTVRREDTVSAPNWNYSAADQSADGVSAPFTFEVAQISELYGPGLFTRIDING